MLSTVASHGVAGGAVTAACLLAFNVMSHNHMHVDAAAQDQVLLLANTVVHSCVPYLRALVRKYLPTPVVA